MTFPLKRLAILPALLVATSVSGCMTVPATPNITPGPQQTYGLPVSAKGIPVIDQTLPTGGWQDGSIGEAIPVTIISPQAQQGRPQTGSIPIVQPRPLAQPQGPVLITYQN